MDDYKEGGVERRPVDKLSLLDVTRIEPLTT